MIQIYETNLTPDVLSKIQELDNHFYTKTMTDLKWYTDRYKPYHKAFILIDEYKHSIVGYAMAVPIDEKLFNALTNGVLVGDIGINPEMFVRESEFMYISSVLILEQYRGLGYGSKLLEILLKFYSGKKICCITVSENGRKLVEKYLSHYRYLPDNEHVFVSENFKKNKDLNNHIK